MNNIYIFGLKCLFAAIFILNSASGAAQQFYGNTFQYELKSNDSLYLDLVLFVDCRSFTNFNPDSIELSGNSSTKKYEPELVSRKDVTPAADTSRSQCNRGALSFGIEKQVYRIGVALDQDFPGACKITFSWDDKQVLPYKQGHNESVYMKGWVNYCQMQKGQSPEYAANPPFFLKEGSFGNYKDINNQKTYDPWLSDPNKDSIKVNFSKLENKNGLSPYYYNSCKNSNCQSVNCDFFPCCPSLPYPYGTAAIFNSTTGSLTINSECQEEQVYFENEVTEYHNGTPVAQKPYEYALTISYFFNGKRPQIPNTVCVGDTFAQQFNDTSTQDSTYLTHIRLLDTIPSLPDSLVGSVIKGDFHWVPTPKDYQEQPYKMKIRAENADQYTIQKTKTKSITVQQDTSIDAAIVQNNRVCDSLYIKVDSVTGPGPFQFSWRVNGYWYPGDSVFTHQFSKNGTYPIHLEIKSDKACRHFHYYDTIKVNNLVEKATIKAPDSSCVGENPLLTANGQSPKDSFSFQWNNGLTGDTIRPVIQTDSTFKVTVTNQDGCSAQDTAFVGTFPYKPLNCQPPTKTYCWNGPADTLNICNHGVTWQGPGIQQDSIFHPAQAYNGQADTVALVATYQDSFGCTYHDTVNAHLKAKPDLNLPELKACQDGDRLDLPDSAANGTLTWQGKGVQDSIFNPHLIDLGNALSKKVYPDYQYHGPGGCQFTDSHLVVVNKPSPSLPGKSVCVNEGPLRLADRDSSNYYFKWQDSLLTNDTFYPSQVDPGTYSIQYFASDSVTTCDYRDSMALTVKDTPAVNAGPNLTVCPKDTTLKLQGTPQAGIWEGEPVLGDSSVPLANTNPGPYQLRYEYQDPSTQCSNADTMQLTIKDRPEVTFTAQPDSGEVPLTVQFQYIGSDSLKRYQWSVGNHDTAAGPAFTHVFRDTGWFSASLRGVSPLGCRDTLTKKDLIRVMPEISGLALEELNGIRLYPNPANERIHLEFGEHKVNMVTLHATSGKVLRRLQVKQVSELTIATTGLEAGAYWVRVHLANGQTGVKKVVIR